MRVLVFGDRNWDNPTVVDEVLDRIHAERPITCIIQGEARGADTCGKMWGWLRIGRANTLGFPALWDRYGRGAGPIRNQQQLDEGRPDLGVGFHNDIAHSKGSADMKRRLEKAGVPVEIYTELGRQV